MQRIGSTHCIQENFTCDALYTVQVQVLKEKKKGEIPKKDRWEPAVVIYVFGKHVWNANY